MSNLGVVKWVAVLLLVFSQTGAEDLPRNRAAEHRAGSNTPSRGGDFRAAPPRKDSFEALRTSYDQSVKRLHDLSQSSRRGQLLAEQRSREILAASAANRKKWSDALAATNAGLLEFQRMMQEIMRGAEGAAGGSNFSPETLVRDLRSGRQRLFDAAAKRPTSMGDFPAIAQQRRAGAEALSTMESARMPWLDPGPFYQLEKSGSQQQLDSDGFAKTAADREPRFEKLSSQEKARMPHLDPDALYLVE